MSLRNLSGTLMGLVPEPLRAAALYAFGIAWSKGLALLMVPLLTSRMSPADFGRLDLLSSGAEVGGLLVGAGLVDTLFRFASAPGPEGTRSAADVLGLALAVSLIGLCAVAALGIPLARAVPLPTAPWEIRLLGASVCMEALIGVPLGWLRMKGRAVAYVLATVVRASAQGALVAALVWSGHGVGGVLAGGAAAALAAAILLSGRQAASTGVRFSPGAWKRLLGYGLPLVAGGLASFALGTADRWLLAPAVAAAQLGTYGLACKFGSLAALLTQPFELWWFPRRMGVLCGPDGLRRSARVADALLGFALLSAAATALAAPPLIDAVTPAAYHGAAALAPWIALSLCFQQCSSLVNVGCYARKTGAAPMLVNGAAAIVAVGGYLLLIPSHGVTGAIVATVAAQAFRFLVYFVASGRVAPVPHRVGALLALAACCAASAALPWFMTPGTGGALVGVASLLASAAFAFGSGILPRRAAHAVAEPTHA